MEKKIDVMVVGFGDWRENWIVNGEWCGWNVWFMMKRMIDDMVKGYEWNKNCGCDDVEIDFVEVMKGFDIKDCGYFMDVRNEVCSEFGMMVFNVEKMKELGNKVVKSDGSVVEDEWDDWMCIGDDWDEEMKYMVMSDWNCGRYKLVGIDMVDEMRFLK